MRVGLSQRGQTTCTLLTWIGTGMSRLPADCVRVRGRWWRLAMFRPGTTTPSPRLVRSTRSTVPRLPRSLPASTMTVSPFLTFMRLQHLRCERDDLHVVALPELAGHRPEDARAARAALRGDQHRRVLVETDVAAVRPPVLLGGTHHHGPHHVALLDAGVGQRLLDAGHDHVAHLGRIRAGAADDRDA